MRHRPHHAALLCPAGGTITPRIRFVLSLTITIAALVLPPEDVLGRAAQSRGLQTADIYRLRSVGDVQIAPNGLTIVYTVVSNDRPGRPYSRVWIMDVTS